jgi:hypothetical protein
MHAIACKFKKFGNSKTLLSGNCRMRNKLQISLFPAWWAAVLLIIRIAGLTDATQAAIITAVMKGNDL